MGIISEDIKNKKYKNVYLLYGDEACLRESYKRALVNALTVPSDTLNYARFSGKETNPAEVVSLANTLPFMAAKRVITVDDSGFFKNACDDIAEYIAAPSEDTCLIFNESEIDKRGRAYKAAQKAGFTVEASHPDENELKRWIAGNLKRAGKNIRENTVELIMSTVGTDMYLLDGELNKLISYTGEINEVTDDDIKAVCTVNPSDSIFKLIEAMALQRQKEAVRIYYELVDNKEAAPLVIISLIARQFRVMLTVREMTDAHVGRDAIAARAGIPPFSVGRYQAQSGKFSRKKMIDVLEDCVKSNYEIRQGKITDRLAAELLVIRYSN